MPDAVDPTLVEITSEVVTAYMAKNHVPSTDIPALIASVHAAFVDLGRPAPDAKVAEKLVPPVPIRKSIADDFIVSLEDGRRYKALKRHLAGLGMTPDEYRAKWGLPSDYPMVAPSYSRARSALAKEMGLGERLRKR